MNEEQKIAEREEFIPKLIFAGWTVELQRQGEFSGKYLFRPPVGSGIRALIKIDDAIEQYKKDLERMQRGKDNSTEKKG